MARIAFENLTPYSAPGGTIAGRVVLEVDKPARAKELVVRLFGRELTQATVREGKSNVTVKQESIFLEQEFDVRSAVQFQDPDHVTPGTYRADFQFALPPETPPSLRTNGRSPGEGTLGGQPNGAYVTYTVESRLEVPLWPDLVSRTDVPVYSSRRLLGTLPDLSSPERPGHPAVSITSSGSPPIVPGSAFQANYQIENPGAKSLRRLDFFLSRVVEYQVRGVAGVVRGPVYSVTVPLGGREARYIGALTIPIPNEEDATAPSRGDSYASFWTAKVLLDVELGFNVEFEIPLTVA